MISKNALLIAGCGKKACFTFGRRCGIINYMFYTDETELKNMADTEFLEYKGKPIVRKGDTIYYGSSSEKYVVMLKILSEKLLGGEKTADRVSVQLISTDDSLSPSERVSKSSEKNGLYNALDIGAIWLERALKK